MAGAALVLAACATEVPHWSRPGITAYQLEADRDECLARSQDYLPTGESKPNYPALERCMERKGYTRSSTGR